jgi:predicted transglutaminase-like cysteine proteinase
MFRNTLRRRLLIVLGVSSMAALAQSVAPQMGSTSRVSERLMGQFATRFGPAARTHLSGWQQFARDRRSLGQVPDPAVLAAVNTQFNRLPYRTDQAHWSAEDYWATPAETVASNGSDCEDYSISKYFMLKELGVPISRLRITYVTSSRIREPHMVLAYYATPDAEPLVLDNLDSNVRPASQRSDLTPVYSFNDDEVWLAQKGRAGSALQIRKWRDLIEKLGREAAI